MEDKKTPQMPGQEEAPEPPEGAVAEPTEQPEDSEEALASDETDAAEPAEEEAVPAEAEADEETEIETAEPAGISEETPQDAGDAERLAEVGETDEGSEVQA